MQRELQAHGKYPLERPIGPHLNKHAICYATRARNAAGNRDKIDTMVDYTLSTQRYFNKILQEVCEEKFFKTVIKAVSYIHIKM